MKIITALVGLSFVVGCSSPAENPEVMAPDAEPMPAPACVASSRTCSTDGSTVVACDATGQIESTETCAAGCVDEASGARCRKIVPTWLPQICDTPAAVAAYTLPFNLDTSVDTSCVGGVIAQPGGPELCVIRARTIQVNTANVKSTAQKNRALALVADDALEILGVLDVSAHGSANGPGGGFTLSGDAADTNRGGGGAGFRQVGGAGGASETVTTGGAGGTIFDPLAAPFAGGPRPRGGAPVFNATRPAPGGGGGGALLIACKGTVRVTGRIEAGGGGGSGGRDIFAGPMAIDLRDASASLRAPAEPGLAIDLRDASASLRAPAEPGLAIDGAAGGGAGGYVVLQGMAVSVTGAITANGGSGGGGCATDNCVGLAGKDGATGADAPGGGAASDFASGVGGLGGTNTSAPTAGAIATTGPGGGGGSTGRIQMFTPSGAMPIVTGAMQPPPESHRSIPTH